MSIAFMALLAGCMLAGCHTTPWVRGRLEEGMPKIERRFPADAAFHVAKTEKRVKNAFEKALAARGFEVAEKEEESDFVVRTSVDSWEFNDAGFGGLGHRDDMELSVTLVDRRRNRVVARAKISLRSDFGIIAKYVELF